MFGWGRGNEPATDGPSAEPAVLSDKDRAELYLKMASHHLARVAALADTEWKVSLAFWAGLAAGGATLIGAAGRDPLTATLIYLANPLLLVGLLAGASIFVFGFSGNQGQSITTERNRFLFFQNLALGEIDAQHPSRIGLSAPAGHDPLKTVPRSHVRHSVVWAMKLVSTSALVAAIWAVTVVAALLKSDADRAAMRVGLCTTAISVAIWAAWTVVVIRLVGRARQHRR